MLIFYLIAFIVNVVIFGGFIFRYRQNPSVKAYLHLGIAVLGQAISSGLLAFLGDLLFSSYIVSLVIVYVSAIIGSLSGLLMIMVILGLIRTWITSMRTGVAIPPAKLDTSDKVLRYLRIAYPVLTAASILFYVLLIVSLGFAGLLVLIVGLAFTITMVAQCAILVWMYLDLHRQGSGNPSELQKRNQLLKLAGLTFFGAWPAMLAGVGTGVGAGIGGALCWWVWYGIALWPGALLALDEPVQPAVGGDKYPAAAAYDQQQYAYGNGQPQTQQPPQQFAQPPQAAYQPQYQQQYGGQPQQQYGGYPQQ